MPDSPDPLITRVLDDARRNLLETGTRNRLIHVNRDRKTGNFLNIINERTDDVFDLLRLQSKRMRFKPMGRDAQPGADAPQEEFALATAQDLPDAGDAPVDDARYLDQFLETPLGPEAQARRLLRLFLDARTAEEEQGLNILYLAMGFLRWRESDSSDIWREAPLILLPVELVRNERTGSFDIRARDDDVTTNLPLQERLRQDFGIVLPSIDDSEEWLPRDYAAAVTEATAARPGWSVEADAMQLGFFSFAKLLMHRDLDPAQWPGSTLSADSLAGCLLSSGFDGEASPFGPRDRLDVLLDPADIVQVVDADASQTKVIEEVKRGANLVVQGPPGTGKSQTITNIIAAAVHEGKTVLFVAEKMAALTVVHQRLVRTGLRDICLELHSRSANKKALAQELGRTLTASAAALPDAPSVDALRASRDRLNRIAEVLHDPLPGTDDTPFGAMAEIIGLIGRDVPAPCIPPAGLDALGPEARHAARAAIATFVTAMDEAGPPEAHPFRGTAAHDLQPTDLTRLAGELAEATAAIDALCIAAADLAAAIGQPVPETVQDAARLAGMARSLAGAPEGMAEQINQTMLDRAEDPRLSEALAAGVAWIHAFKGAEADFARTAFGAALDTARPGIVAGQSSFLRRLFGPYRAASAALAAHLATPLPKSPADRLALLDRLLEVQTLRRRLADEEGYLQSALGEHWRGERTPFARIDTLAQWLAGLRRSGLVTLDAILPGLAALPDPAAAAGTLTAAIDTARSRIDAPVARLRLDPVQAGLGEGTATAPLAGLRAALSGMGAQIGRYAQWATLGRSMAGMIDAGAGDVIDAVADGRVLPSAACDEFRYACAEARWNAARRSRPALSDLAGEDRHALVERFRRQERDRLSQAQTLILARHFAQMPRGSAGEMGIIRGEIGRKSRHKSIRWVMTHAGSMVQRIKPVMLMSPLSTAQFLPPGKVAFDLLVIDEASQIRPEDALGVVARARQIVVVGDQKQLPPTSFFDRLIDDTEEPDHDEDAGPVGATASDMESILTLCEARGLRSRMLEWHYRSRDPSLIAVSNAEFYDHGLILPPSPLQLDDDYGLKFNRVPGVYARGTSGPARPRTNRIEAQAVVSAVARHARSFPGLSLGIVAFSKTQADMLTEILEFERRSDPVLDAFLRDGQSEDVFVKNIENVQGDERDVIFISVGYGPQEPNGRLASQSFGPVNGEGGERRLNVLFSRARVRCEVFASFDPADIDPSRSLRVGPRVLKRFLDFAKSGRMEESVPTGQGADSPFEEDVIRVIRGLGYLADPQVGSGGFRIDIGVRHPDRPGQYLVAVECDGAAYHSALWARERDRLRQDVLEGLGWRFHRIWSTDWFHRRDQEMARLSAALDDARAAHRDGIQVRGANEGGRILPPETGAEAPAPPVDIAHLHLTAPPYQRADIVLNTLTEPHEARPGFLADLVARIVAVEGPIHIDELARRIAAAFGKNRTGSRISEAVARAVPLAVRGDPSLRWLRPYIMTAAQQADPPVRDRSAETGTLLKADYLPPVEIRAAAARIRAESGEMPPEDLVRAIARLLGFQRVGPDLNRALLAATQEVLTEGG